MGPNPWLPYRQVLVGRRTHHMGIVPIPSHWPNETALARAARAPTVPSDRSTTGLLTQRDKKAGVGWAQRRHPVKQRDNARCYTREASPGASAASGLQGARSNSAKAIPDSMLKLGLDRLHALCVRVLLFQTFLFGCVALLASRRDASEGSSVAHPAPSAFSVLHPFQRYEVSS